jgi:hypothetical protein
MSKKYPKLSNKQTTRLGGLIAVSCGRQPHNWLLDELIKGEFVSDQSNVLTIKGMNELGRLMKLLGISVGYLNDDPDIQATNDQRTPSKTACTR